jgi:L-aminopeptidase/D-esterase-like protein
LVAGPRRDDDGFDDPVEMLLQVSVTAESSVLENTTIGIVATDAALSREDTNYLARVSHDGLAMAIRPCHTIRDGDTMFAMSTGCNSDPVDLTVLGAAAVEATAQAVLRGVRTATGLGGIPAVGDLAGP